MRRPVADRCRALVAVLCPCGQVCSSLCELVLNHHPLAPCGIAHLQAAVAHPTHGMRRSSLSMQDSSATSRNVA